MENKEHGTSTTVKLDAGTKKYHCIFFCQRKTTENVINPIAEKRQSVMSATIPLTSAYNSDKNSELFKEIVNKY